MLTPSTKKVIDASKETDLNKPIQVYGPAPLKHVFKVLHSVAKQFFRQSPWLTKVRFGGAGVMVGAVVFERGERV